MKPLTAAALLLTLGATTLSAQHPQVRDGFWIAFGFGGGWADFSCNGCPNTDREMSGTGFVRLGGTLNDHVLLGAEMTGWGRDDPSRILYLANTSFAVYYYPRPAGGLFVRGGVGFALASMNATGPRAEANGFGFIVGGGYDIRVGRQLSITPAASYHFGADGDLKANGILMNTGAKHNILEFALGLTFH